MRHSYHKYIAVKPAGERPSWVIRGLARLSVEAAQFAIDNPGTATVVGVAFQSVASAAQPIQIPQSSTPATGGPTDGPIEISEGPTPPGHPILIPGNTTIGTDTDGTGVDVNGNSASNSQAGSDGLWDGLMIFVIGVAAVAVGGTLVYLFYIFLTTKTENTDPVPELENGQNNLGASTEDVGQTEYNPAFVHPRESSVHHEQFRRPTHQLIGVGDAIDLQESGQVDPTPRLENGQKELGASGGSVDARASDVSDQYRSSWGVRPTLSDTERVVDPSLANAWLAHTASSDGEAIYESAASVNVTPSGSEAGEGGSVSFLPQRKVEGHNAQLAMLAENGFRFTSTGSSGILQMGEGSGDVDGVIALLEQLDSDRSPAGGSSQVERSNTLAQHAV